MPNPLFQMLVGNNQPMGDGGIGQIAQELSDFRKNFRGDARQTVQALLNSGRMTQDQYNQLSQMATQIYNAMNGNF